MARTAIKRREILRNPRQHLEAIKETVDKLDPYAKIYLFGSFAENLYTYSSDIDVLIVTKEEPARIHLELWKKGVREPFEIHVQPPENIDFYRRAGLVKI